MGLKTNYIAFFHLIVVFHHITAIHYDFMQISAVELQIRKFTYGGRLIYLSVWNMFIQSIYFVMAFINDFIEAKDTHTSNYRPLFTQVKNYIFTSLAFPLALHIGSVFWFFYFLNRDLGSSKELQELIPDWFTHMTRTNIVIFVIIELFLTSRNYPKYFEALTGLLTVLITYIAWTLVIFYNTGHWIHPIFDNFTWLQRAGFFGFNVCVPVTYYFIGEFINNQWWNRKKSKVLTRARSQKGRSSKPDLICENNIERSSEV